MAKIHVFFNIKRRYYLIIDNAFLINKLSIFGVNSLEKNSSILWLLVQSQIILRKMET